MGSSSFVDGFVKDHKEYFLRNKNIIENNRWNDVEIHKDKLKSFSQSVLEIKEGEAKDKDKQLKEIEKDIKTFLSVSAKNKKALFEQENKLTTSITSRLTDFISESQGDRSLKKTQDFIDFTVDIINTHLKKCNEYLRYNQEVINKEDLTEDEIEFNDLEIVFQDEIFNKKIAIQSALSKLNINNSSDNLQIKFFKDQKATIPMIGVFINNQNYPEIRDITRALNLPKTTKDTSFFIHKKKVPDWNHKKHYWEQDRPVLDFWWNEYLKITNGITIDSYFIYPWLYFHLNFFKTAIPVDGKVPIINPPLRDNELYFSELLKARDVQKNVGILIYGSRRISKALRNDQVLHYIDGTQRPIGDAKVGDKIFGSDGKPTGILGVYPQGKVDLYEVELYDGRKSICCDEHLWTVYDYQAKIYKTLPLKEMIRGGWNYDRKRKWKGKDEVSIIPKYFIPMSECVQYQENKLSIDPYYLGMWLGDGTSVSPSITTIDEPIKNYLKDFAEKENLIYKEVGKQGTNAVTVKLNKKEGLFNSLLGKLRDKNLVSNKHIPEEYLTSSEFQRMELLRGMMDTDGTIGENGGGMSYTTIYPRLASDFHRLCLSLGIACYKQFHTGAYVKKDGTLNTFYQITLFTSKPIFKLERKLNRIDKIPNVGRIGRMNKSAVVNIIKIESDYATCIRVDNEKKEFITNDFIVTHNSTNIASIAQWKLLTTENSSSTIASGSDSDVLDLGNKIKDSMTNMVTAFSVHIQKQEWSSGDVDMGLKDGNILIPQSKHKIKNLETGAAKKSQTTAGGNSDFFVIEEIGKCSWEKAYLAAQPSFETPDGYRTIPLLIGTSGESSLSKDSLRAVSNPSSMKLMEMDWDLLEKYMPQEAITWERTIFASFMPAQMAYKTGFKRIAMGLGDYLGIESKELNKIEILKTDWINNTKILLEDRARLKGDSLKLQQEIVQYPIKTSDCFLSSEKNIFHYEEAVRRREYLEQTGQWDRRFELYRDHDGKIKKKPSNKPLAEYPHKGGNIDCPYLIFEDFPEEKQPLYTYVAGGDFFKQESSDTDSVGTIYIFKYDILGDKWAYRLVASYASRPETFNEFNKNCLMLLEAYNAVLFPENEDVAVFQSYLEKQHLQDYYLMPHIDFNSTLEFSVNGNRKIGWTPSQSKRKLLNMFANYTKEDVKITNDAGEEVTMERMHTINDIYLLDEIINYNKDANVDRIIACLGAIGWLHYLEKNFIHPKRFISQKDVEKKVKERVRSPYSVNGIRKKNPFSNR